jgi:Tfp pilus assembly protein PilN
MAADVTTRGLSKEVIELERGIAELHELGVDTAAAEKELNDLRQRCTSVQAEGVSKLSQMLAAVDSLSECEHERVAILQWMKQAEDQLKGIDNDDSLSPEEKLKLQEVAAVGSSYVLINNVI